MTQCLMTAKATWWRTWRETVSSLCNSLVKCILFPQHLILSLKVMSMMDFLLPPAPESRCSHRWRAPPRWAPDPSHRWSWPQTSDWAWWSTWFRHCEALPLPANTQSQWTIKKWSKWNEIDWAEPQISLFYSVHSTLSKGEVSSHLHKVASRSLNMFVPAEQQEAASSNRVKVSKTCFKTMI